MEMGSVSTRKEYTIKTRITISDITYYRVAEVCKVLGYKTQKQFKEKYNDKVAKIQGCGMCITADDYLKVAVKENTTEKECDLGTCDVKFEVKEDLYKDMNADENYKSVYGDFTYQRAYTVSKQSENATFPKVKTFHIEFGVNELNQNFDTENVRVAIKKALQEIDSNDSNTFNCILYLLRADAISIREEMIRKVEIKNEFIREYNEKIQRENEQAKRDEANRIAEYKSEYRKLCKVCHPDNGGSEELMNIVNRIYGKLT